MVTTVGGVSSRRYAVVVGTVLVLAAVFFAVMPALFDYDAFIPVMLTLVCTLSAITVRARDGWRVIASVGRR